MATVHLLCGKTGSGKTTFARRLEQSGAMRFSVDEWMLRLFGPHMPRKEFDARVALCLELTLELAERLAELGVPVVIDAGFWRRQDRLNVRARLEQKGVRTCLHYFDAPEKELWARVQRRNRDLPKGSFEISRDMFELFSGWFEAPGADEEFRRVEG